MKLAMVIVCLAAIGAGVVHFRRERTVLRNEVQKLETRQIVLRRELWAQQVRMAWLVAPAEVRRRAKDLGLPLSDQARVQQGPSGTAAGTAPPRRR